MHHNIERFLNGLEYDRDIPEMAHFEKFYEDHMLNKIIPYRTEWRIACPIHKIAGTVDFVGRKPDGNYVLIDWKRSKKLEDNLTNNFNRKAKYPLDDLDDCDGVKYSLQLNIYRYILQKHYGITVDNLIVASFHPNLETYFSFDVEVNLHSFLLFLLTFSISSLWTRMSQRY